MNKNILKGKLQQAKGEIQKKFGEITDSDLDEFKGDAKIMLGKLQEKYGLTLEEAKQRLEEYNKNRKS